MRHRPAQTGPSVAASRRRPAFTLFELMVVLAITAMIAAVAFPVLRRLRTSTVHMQFRAETLAAMQANTSILISYRASDADNGEPRLPGDTYDGTAVIFDRDRGLVRFANNNQGALDVDITDPNNLNRRIENQTYTWSWTNPARSVGPMRKKAYDIIRQLEPVRIPPSVGLLGIVRDDKGTPLDTTDDTLQMVQPPFAVCCGADAYGLPVSPAIYANLGEDNRYTQIPTVLPAVVVYMRSDLTDIGVDPDNLDSGPLAGLSDNEKINLILGQEPRHGHGLLVLLALQNGSRVDTP